MIIFVSLVFLILLEWLKKIIFETTEDRDTSYAWMLSVLVFIPYFFFVILTQSSSDSAYYEYDGGYVVRPQDVQEKRSFIHVITGTSFLMCATAIVVSVIHNLFLLKYIHKQHKDDYINLASNLIKVLLLAPFISAAVILFVAMSNVNTIGWLLSWFSILVLVFYAVSFFAIRRVESIYDYPFEWGSFLRKFFIYNIISIMILVLSVLIAVANTDFSN